MSFHVFDFILIVKASRELFLILNENERTMKKRKQDRERVITIEEDILHYTQLMVIGFLFLQSRK